MWSISRNGGPEMEAAAAADDKTNLMQYLQETKNNIETQKQLKLTEYRQQMLTLTEKLKMLTELYHANQRYKINRELHQLKELIKTTETGANWDVMEQQSQKYVQLFEQEQLLDRIEKKFRGGVMSYRAADSLLVGNQHGHADYSNLCLSKLQGKAPTVQIKTIPTCSTPSCREQVLTLDSIHSQLVCSKCGRTQLFFDATSEQVAYGGEVEITAFTYKRQSHFKDHLTYAQGKESTRVPDDVLIQICTSLRDKFGFRSKEHITLDDVTKTMKLLRLRKYYKNRVQVHVRITGRPPLRLTSAQEQRMIHAFRQLQPAFDRHQPNDRQSFFSYRYALYRLCEYFDLFQFQKLFPLPKSPKKLKSFDQLFALIVADLNWDFRKFKLLI